MSASIVLKFFTGRGLGGWRRPEKMCDKGGVIQNMKDQEGGGASKKRWGILLYYLTKDGLH